MMTSEQIDQSIDTSVWLWALARAPLRARLGEATFSLRVFASRADAAENKRRQLEKRLVTERRTRAIDRLKRAETVYLYGAAAWGAIAFDLLKEPQP